MPVQHITHNEFIHARADTDRHLDPPERRMGESGVVLVACAFVLEAAGEGPVFESGGSDEVHAAVLRVR
jgi:hypothetical protein